MATHPVTARADEEKALLYLQMAFGEHRGLTVPALGYRPAAFAVRAVANAIRDTRECTLPAKDGGVCIPVENVPEHIALIAEGRDMGFIHAGCLSGEFPGGLRITAEAILRALDEIISAYYRPNFSAHSAHNTDRKETLMTQNQNTAGRIVFAPAAYDPLLNVVVWEMTNRLVAICHGAAAHAGWWKNPKTGDDPRDNPMCFAQKLCLIHSEISEAMEGDRKSLKDDKLPHRDMREVELADALIRIADLAGAYGMDLGGAVAEKLLYNSQRADHKVENRVQDGGKAY